MSTSTATEFNGKPFDLTVRCLGSSILWAPGAEEHRLHINPVRRVVILRDHTTEEIAREHVISALGGHIPAACIACTYNWLAGYTLCTYVFPGSTRPRLIRVDKSWRVLGYDHPEARLP